MYVKTLYKLGISDIYKTLLLLLLLDILSVLSSKDTYETMSVF